MLVFVIIDLLVVVLAVGFAWRNSRARCEPVWWAEFERDFRAYVAQGRTEAP
jgi:hypothetical protein